MSSIRIKIKGFSGYTCPIWPCYSICATFRTSATTALVVDNIVHQSIYSTEILPAQTSAGAPLEYAYPIQIRWKDSDFATNTSPVTTPTETSSDSTSQPGSKNLSTGAIAAIAIVVPLTVLAGLTLVLWWLRKKRKVNSESAATEATLAVGSKPEMDGRGMSARELDATRNPVYELQSQRAIG